MSSYVISCCSTADLSKAHLDSRDIKYVCFHYYIDKKAYMDDLGETMDIKEFYSIMEGGADIRTSQVNSEEYFNYFEQFLKEGLDVVHLTLSSGISGTINSAYIAKDMLKEKYPDRKVKIIDSLAASSGFGLLVDKAADLRDEGMSMTDLVDWLEENKLKINHWFFTTDLKYFIKGGRVSVMSGTIGNILNICPLLNVSDKGKLIPRMKIRTKKKVMAAMVDKMAELADDGLDYQDKCYISHSMCEDDARAVASLVESRFPKLKGRVLINDIGTTIGAHTGPGTVALFFWGNKRID